ncbi:MAG: NADH-quinone oxidoreductase subunit N [Bacteroidetes bacterium]|nr:NADH-quinone oxidoreductase subunit N [Bacteroidota bacterium]
MLVLLRYEFILVALIVIFLLAWLIPGKSEDRSLSLFWINVLLFINFLFGFIPVEEGVLFNNMFYTNEAIGVQKMLLNFGALIISLQAYDWLKSNRNAFEFYLLLISTLLGMFFMISARNLLMLYVGLEMATLPLAALAAFETDSKRSAESGIKLILNSVLSSAIFLFGLALLYGETGSLHFSDMAGKLTGNPDGYRDTTLSLLLVFTGFGFKISIVPFHLWTADVYEGAPVSITSYLSVISKSSVVFVFISFLYIALKNMAPLWIPFLMVTSVLTMTLGNIFALRQQNMKRFLAFSSIAQAGYILIGILGASALGMSSVIFFVLIYIFSNLGAFGVVSVISAQTGKENLDDYKGMYHTNPMLSLLLLLSMFSLAGVPPTAGFFGKLFMLMAAAGKGYYILILIAALNMIISLYYYLRIIKSMFMDKSESPIAYFRSSIYSRIALVICFAGIILTGFFSGIFDYFYSISFGI